MSSIYCNAIEMTINSPNLIHRHNAKNRVANIDLFIDVIDSHSKMAEWHFMPRMQS